MTRLCCLHLLLVAIRGAQISIEAGGSIILGAGGAGGADSSTVANLQTRLTAVEANCEARVASLEAEVRQLRRDAGFAPPAQPPASPPLSPLLPPLLPPSPMLPPSVPVQFIGQSTPGQYCVAGGWSSGGHSEALLAAAPGGIEFTMPPTGPTPDVIIGLSSPGDGTSFTSISYSVYFRGAGSGAAGDLMAYSGTQSGVAQYGAGSANHLLGSGQDWFAGSWATSIWSFRVTSATHVDFYADGTLLYSWTAAVSFPLKVSTYNYAGGCAQNVKWP